MKDFTDMHEEELKVSIEDMTWKLSEAKKAYREKRFAGVRLAVEARNQAEEDLSGELRRLGVNYRSQNNMFSALLP